MPSNEGDRNKAIRDERHQAMSNAALSLFVKKGFSATKISDITDAANSSHGLFYHYFKSKEALFKELIINILDLFIDTVEAAKQHDDSAWNQLAWFTESTYTASLDKGLKRHILITQAFHSEFLPKSFKQLMKDKYTLAINGITSIIKLGQQQGHFIEGDPLELAVYYQSLNHGLTLWNVKDIQPIHISADKVMRHLKA